METSFPKRVLRFFLNLNLNYVFVRLGLIRSKFVPDSAQSVVLNTFFSSEAVSAIRSAPRYTEGIVDFESCRMKYSDNFSFVSMINEIFVNNNYRYAASAHPFIIDCGANVGLSALYFARSYPGAAILAIEADPYICSLLQDNVSTNGLSGVTVLNRAVWTDESELEFVSDRSWGGHLKRDPTDRDATVKIKGIDLASLIDREVDFLKMDLEGAESAVIRHAKEKIALFVKHFFFEYHSSNGQRQELGEILSFFETNGFRYHIKEASPKSAPFLEKRLTHRMDCQLDVFLYKI